MAQPIHAGRVRLWPFLEFAASDKAGRTGAMADLTIANSVSDLIQGDVREHLPLERIPLKGDVLGLGTTSSLENGELTFLRNGSGDSEVWRCIAHNGSIVRLKPGDGSGHFPYVCYTEDATALQRPVELSCLGKPEGRSIQELIDSAIRHERARGALEQAPIYGIRMLATWDELVITVASKLCMGQQRRNASFTTEGGTDQAAATSIYDMLQHYRLSPLPQEKPEDPIRYLGRSMQWDCCGFYDSEPEKGRVTVPKAGDYLHLHGCSTDLAHGGHVLHDHPSTRVGQIEQLVLYPLHSIRSLCSDLAIESLSYDDGRILFRVTNTGELDVSDVGVAVVVNDRFSDHRYLQIPWMNAGDSESYSLAWAFPSGVHRIAVIADPMELVIEPDDRRHNNLRHLEVTIPSSDDA